MGESNAWGENETIGSHCERKKNETAKLLKRDTCLIIKLSQINLTLLSK
jgi:hypothetical protein